MENENTPKVLDLFDIIKIIWGWFLKFIWNPAIFVLKFVLNRWWVGVLAIVTGIGIAIFMNLFFPVYTGMIIFRNNVCSSSDFVSDVRLMTKASPKSKAEMFNISLKDAAAIKAIWAHQLCYLDTLNTSYVVDELDKLAVNGYASVPNMFAVEIAMKDKCVFDTIQNALLNYFNTSDYYVQQNRMRFESSVSKIDVIEKEKTKLDSIESSLDGRLLTSESSVVNGMVTSQLLSPSVISNEIIRMNNDISNMSFGLKFYPNVVDVVSPLKTQANSDNFFLETWKGYVAACIVMFYVLALLIVYRKKVASFIKG